MAEGKTVSGVEAIVQLSEEGAKHVLEQIEERLQNLEHEADIGVLIRYKNKGQDVKELMRSYANEILKSTDSVQAAEAYFNLLAFLDDPKDAIYPKQRFSGHSLGDYQDYGPCARMNMLVTLCASYKITSLEAYDKTSLVRNLSKLSTLIQNLDETDDSRYHHETGVQLLKLR